jgi:5-(hydroxymethyl)furfural/furfural oxidase
MANRGAPADYDEWEALGARGWNWEACLPYFGKLETDSDFSGELHGTSGPVRIQRPGWPRISPFVQSVLGTLQQRGHVLRDDQNGRWEDGTFIGSIAVSAAGDRIPTSVCYLDDAARARKILSIRTGLVVERILFGGQRAIGARIVHADGAHEDVHAGRVIISAGAIHSPALLLRSGIGPASDLSALGIEVRVNRAGVGRNLMEHPSIAVSAFLPRAARTPFPDEHHEQAIVRFSSGMLGTVPGDMHGAILSRSGWHSVGYRLGTIFFWVNKSYSRGQLKLTSTSPFDEPDVDFAMLSDQRDLERLKLALRFGAQTLAAPSMSAHRDAIFPSSYSPRVAAVAVPGAWNAVQRGTLSALLDVAGPLREWLIRRVVTQGVSITELLADDHAMTAFVARSVGGTWHPSGTCRMGAPGDPMAVTDSTGAVYGVDRLHVCDASLMPSIPCANTTNVPTIMVSERVADLVRGLGDL